MFITGKVPKIISDQNKAHGHYDIWIRMIKTCVLSIIKLLDLLFNNCVKRGVFIWEMANVFPVHKKTVNN